MSGIGFGLGTKGARITKKSNGGKRTTLSVPGTGISFVKEKEAESKKEQAEAHKAEEQQKEPVTETATAESVVQAIGAVVAADALIHMTILHNNRRAIYGF